MRKDSVHSSLSITEEQAKVRITSSPLTSWREGEEGGRGGREEREERGRKWRRGEGGRREGGREERGREE